MHDARPAPGVVVTGLGSISAWGWNVPALWEGLLSGRTAVGDFDRFPHDGFRTHLAAQVPPEPPGLARIHRGWSGLSRADRFAVAAAAEALTQAELPDRLGDSGAGVYFGSSTGGMPESEAFYEAFRDPARRRSTSLRLIASQEVGGPGDAVARRFHATRGARTVSSACASATLAIGCALDALRAGEVHIAIAGGSDALCRITYGGFNALRSVDPAPSRPFRAGREGLSLGEGAGVLVLETEEHARARGARVLARLVGAGSASDAHHMTAPQPQGAGAAAAFRAALQDCELRVDDIGFFHAHGTGTPLNDAAEWMAMREVLGARAGDVPVTSAKGAIGHLLGAAGAVEAVAATLCVMTGRVHPSAGTGAVDPATPVDLVIGAPRRFDRPRPGVSLNLGFGGCNAALLIAPAGAAEGTE